MMNFEMWLSIVGLLNVIICLVIIIIAIWQNTIIKQYSQMFFALLAVTFALQIWQIISPIEITQLIVLLTLFIVLYQVITNDKKQIKTQPLIDTSKIIAQSKEEERSRIYANLHDDVGAKLLELIYSAQDNRTKELAKEVLSDIRQAVASTINIQCTAQQLIDEILAECSLRLEAANIGLLQEIDFEGGDKKLSATIPSTISRVLREVLSNVIKHAQAKQVKIVIKSTSDFLQFSIHDNGIGFKAGQNNGKGLKTIRKRAAAISAEVEWITENIQGTQFTLIYHYANQ